MKANLNEIIKIKTYAQAEAYLNEYFGKILSPIIKKVPKYEVYKQVGTKRAPYGWDHGHYDSTIVEHVIKDWVEVTKDEYDKFTPGYISINGESDYKRVSSKSIQNKLLNDYEAIELTTILNCTNKIKILDLMNDEAFELSQDLYELSNDLEVLETYAELFDKLHSSYATEKNEVAKIRQCLRDNKKKNDVEKEIKRNEKVVKERERQRDLALKEIARLKGYSDVIVVDPKNDKLI